MATVSIQTGLRLDEATYEKLKVLSIQEDRSINSLAVHIIRKYLAEYEQVHGPLIESQAQ